MYTCLECSFEFKNAIKITERHTLTAPPYESIYVCPNCKSGDYVKKEISHCRCCGAKLTDGKKEYCSDSCKEKGEKLWLKEIKRKQLLSDSNIYRLVREVEEYNKNNRTKYSYGQYVAFKKGIKNAKK